MKALITRPRPEAETLAAAFAARGIAALIEPLLRIAPVADAATRLAALLPGIQALVFTSANGARAFAEASARRDLPVYAVGDATAATARGLGFVAVASAGGDVEDLSRLVVARLSPTDGALLHAAGRTVAGDLAGRLGTAGFELHRAVIYTAHPATALSTEAQTALRRHSLDLALFFSPRTAASFVRLARDAGLDDACCSVTAVAFSSAVATELAHLSWRTIRSAAMPTEPALLAAVEAAAAEVSTLKPGNGQKETAR